MGILYLLLIFIYTMFIHSFKKAKTLAPNLITTENYRNQIPEKLNNVMRLIQN